MKIEGPGSARPGQVRKAQKSGGGMFASHLNEGEEEGAVRSSGSQSAVGINPLFALQEVDDALTGKRRRAQARGEDILDRLEELRLGLLTGSFPVEKLHDLVRMVQVQRENLDDPRLQEVLDEIDLRAQVEIAKLTNGG
ncbi:flagellar assembly protein FliX [Niveispirillum sp. BGYR6]|uniref:flagellar assembly protein FliX n=1 Tax=Niveispirillum sp. BGYR6 TaxID=2971249 RepID=UPI0022B9C2EE|nr:flagellar assembly protein FliX [Niveispirillum sp. BGYR6]MDG5493487.1 flagellar assembly protein FliX [Niveispirillum sp. BGYR6]